MALDDTGLHIPDYPELLDQYKAKAKQQFGEDVNVDATSVLGKWLATLAWMNAILYEDVEDGYLANYLDSSTGVSLDRLGNNYSVKRNPEGFATVELQFTGTPGYTLDINDIDQPIYATEDDTEFELIESVTIGDDGKGTGEAVATIAGSTGNVLANTITVQVDRIADITDVTNPLAASGGADVETDDSYRQRIHLSLDSQPGPTLYGLYTALYDLTGVQQVQIVENLTDAKDSAGNPPHSLHFYIRGGQQQEVGQTILDNIAAGIETTGTIKVTAQDIGGHSHDVFFDTATVVPIYIQMTIKTSDAFNPETGPTDIKQAIADYLNGLPVGGLIVYTKLYQAIYNVDGIDDISAVSMGRDKAKMGTVNIQLDQFETAILNNQADVEVTVNG
jgi:uncharacterized phage protein gp47/JayE